MKSLVIVLFFFIGPGLLLSANQAKVDLGANREIPAKDSLRSDSGIIPPKKQNDTSIKQDTSSASRKPAENAEERPSYMLYLLVGVLVIGGGIMWMELRKSER